MRNGSKHIFARRFALGVHEKYDVIRGFSCVIATLREEISKDINDLLSAQNIEASILSQMYLDDDEITNLAKQYGLSEGKANLISRVLKSDLKNSKGKEYTFEELAKLTINDLNILLN